MTGIISHVYMHIAPHTCGTLDHRIGDQARALFLGWNSCDSVYADMTQHLGKLPISFQLAHDEAISTHQRRWSSIHSIFTTLPALG
jgi:hypothetical protein